MILIKLGLVADDPDDLLAYRLTDRGFAHHGTFWPVLKVMWYGPERFDKYRAVGYWNAQAASAALRADADSAAGVGVEVTL